MRWAGPAFIIGFYCLIYLHIDAFLTTIVKILFQRLGSGFAMLWLFVGAILGFNVVFNHTMAMIIKANGPSELIMIERLRLIYKNRIGRK